SHHQRPARGSSPGAMAREHGALSIVDAVTSLAGIPLEVDAWGVDAIYSGSQKCLSAPPGISPVSFNARALDAIHRRRAKPPSWFLDLRLVMDYWGDGRRSYHHTAPVNAIYALHEALLAVKREGLENAWARHRRMHHALRAGVEAINLAFLVEEEYRLPQLNAIKVPAGIDQAQVRATLLRDHHLEIGAGLGALSGAVWRIGLMGHACSERNVLLCLDALEQALLVQDHRCDRGAAVDAAERSLRESEGSQASQDSQSSNASQTSQTSNPPRAA
ncbi:MAG: pyridoxal-phosphate-dependent aminotransferase family protein, partial [bacterium]